MQEADLSENEVSDAANSVAVNVLVSMLDDPKLEKNITAASISKDAVIEFLRQASGLTTDSLLTEDTLQGYQEWLALMDLENSTGRQLKALLEKYSFVLETPESKSVCDVAVETSCLKNPLEHRLAVSHTGRQLLAQAKAHLDQISEEFEIEEMVNDHEQGVADFVSTYDVTEGEEFEIESFNEVWARVEEVEELALKALEAQQPKNKTQSLKNLFSKLSLNRASLFDFVLVFHKRIVKGMVSAALRQAQETVANEHVVAEQSESAITSTENYWHVYRSALEEANCKKYLEKQLSEQVLNKLPARKRMHTQVQDFEKLSNDLYDVLLCIVCSANSSIQALHSDQTWTADARNQLGAFDCRRILSAGLSQEDMTTLQKLIQRITPSEIEKRQGVYSTTKVLLSLFAVGQGETVDRKQISAVGHKLDGLLPSDAAAATDCELAVFLKFLKKLLITLRKSAALGEDGRRDFSIFAEVHKSLAQLIAQWPDWAVEDVNSSGVSDEKNFSFVMDEEKRIRTILLSMYQLKEEALKRLVKQVATFVADLKQGIDEKKYQTSMAAKCGKMATFEQTLKELLEDVNSVTDSVLDIEQEKDVLESGRVARAICFYHVCIFTAFTLYRDPATWHKDASGSKAMETLKTSLQRLLEDEDSFQVEQARDDSFVKQMRKEANVLKPADAASAAPLNWSAWENIQMSKRRRMKLRSRHGEANSESKAQAAFLKCMAPDDTPSGQGIANAQCGPSLCQPC
nr:hypothetical protein [Euryarchaeota archaeon]